MIGALDKLVVFLGVKSDGVEKAEKRMMGLKNVATGLVTALASGVALKGIARVVDEVTTLGDVYAKTAARVGVNAQALQELEFVAGRAGVAVGSFRDGLSRFARNVDDAAQGLGEGKRAFDQLGISVRNADGSIKSSEELMAEVSDQMSKLPDQASRVAVAMRVFGRAGMSMVNMLQNGSEEIAGIRAEFRELGASLTDEELKASEDYRDALLGMQKAMLGLKMAIVRAVLPAIQMAVTWVTRGVATFNKFSRETRIVEAALVTLGAVLAWFAGRSAIAFLPLVIKLLLVGAAIAAVVLVVEDLIAFFQGADSVTGRLLASIGELYNALLDLENWNPDEESGILYFMRFLAFTIKNTLQDLGKLADMIKRVGGGALFKVVEAVGEGPRGWGKSLYNAALGGPNPVAVGPGAAALMSGGGTNMANNTSFEVNITAAPGMDAEAVGGAVATEVDKRLQSVFRDTASQTLRRK